MTTPNGNGVINRGTDYADGSQVTSSNLKEHVDNAVFNDDAVDDVTIGLNSSSPKALFVKNQGIDTAQIKDSAVQTDKINNLAVTDAKIAEDTITSEKLSFIEDSVSVTSGNILIADGTTYDAETMSGDATIASGGALTIANDAVTPAKTSFCGTVDTTANSTTRILSKQSDGDYDSVTPSGDVTMAQDGALTIANDAVTTDKIDDSNVTTAKIADDAVTGDKISDSAVLPNGVTATTQAAGNDTDRVATTSFVQGFRPKYVVATGGTHALTITGQSNLTVKEYNIADFTSSDSDFGTNKITGIVVTSYSRSNGTANYTTATLPDGSFKIISYAAAYSTGDDVEIINQVTIPINSDTTTFSFKYFKSTSQSVTNQTEICGFIIQPNL